MVVREKKVLLKCEKMNLNLIKAAVNLFDVIRTGPEPIRRFRCAVSLFKAGELKGLNNDIYYSLQGRLPDGGWADVEETAWAVAFHDAFSTWVSSTPSLRSESINWLVTERTAEGAWGRSSRDRSRIPVTAWVLTLLPELADENSIHWLETEWRKDLFSEVKLTYKGALALKAFASADYKLIDPDLIPDTVNYLMDEQHDDGGFGPWKNHPIGSEPWSTGIALIGLTAWPELIRAKTLERALAWLERVQLPNGLWPCHYVEEGSAYCYWGAVEAMKYLKRIGR